MEEHLIINWPYFALALATLWFPRPWMKVGRWIKRRRKQRETFDKFAQQGGRDPDDRSVNLGRELSNKRNYIDFFRALVGGYALWHYSFDTSGSTKELMALGIGVMVAVVGLLAQSVRWDEKINFSAPIFYLSGLCIAHGNPYDGLFAFMLTCACNPAVPNPRIFLSLFGVLLLPFGWFFDSSILGVLADSFLVLILPVLSLLVGRPIVIFTKKAD